MTRISKNCFYWLTLSNRLRLLHVRFCCCHSTVFDKMLALIQRLQKFKRLEIQKKIQMKIYLFRVSRKQMQQNINKSSLKIEILHSIVFRG